MNLHILNPHRFCRQWDETWAAATPLERLIICDAVHKTLNPTPRD
jgi:hypothetical protein